MIPVMSLARAFGLTETSLMRRQWHRLLVETDGQDMIEYSLLASAISLVAVVAITNVGTGINGVWLTVDTQMTAAAGAAS